MISAGSWNCDTYRSLSDTGFCEFEEVSQQCCHCGGGEVPSQTECTDGDLSVGSSAGGVYTCGNYENLYGTKW